jgi:hypothetical protein
MITQVICLTPMASIDTLDVMACCKMWIILCLPCITEAVVGSFMSYVLHATTFYFMGPGPSHAQLFNFE